MLKFRIIIPFVFVIAILLFFNINNKKQINNITKVGYNEKIEHFTLYEIKNNLVVNKIQGKELVRYFDDSKLITDAKIEYDDYIIVADRFTSTDKNFIKLSGNVKINDISGIHRLRANDLIIDKNNKTITGNNKAIYFYKQNKIIADSMKINDSNKKINFFGDNIIENKDYQIISKNILIDKQKNLYKSKNYSAFTNNRNKIMADGGFVINDNIITFIKNISAISKHHKITGDKILVNNNKKTYITKGNSEYLNNNINIKANEIIYLEPEQVVKLKGGINATYN